MAGKIILKDLFSGLQNQMSAQLSTNREFILHPGSKGDSLEDTWIEWLRIYLPNRYCIDKAIIIDSTGQLSDQIDLVIYDQQYTPFVFTQNGLHYIPAEGVYAVFEVKPDLQGNIKAGGRNVSYIEYAGMKVESVRKLKRTTTSIIDRGEEKLPRPLTKIVGGILANTNSFKKLETLEKHLKDLKGLQGLDMGCAVDQGAFFIDHAGKEDVNNTDFISRIHDYYNARTVNTIEFSKADVSLVTFFFQLSRYLQQSIGTVGAIDLAEYSKAINFEIDKEL